MQAEVNNFFAGDEAAEAKLYDDDILKELDVSAYNFKHGVSVLEPGEGLKIRALTSGDYDRGESTSAINWPLMTRYLGFFQLLAQLTKVGEPSKADFMSKLSLKCPKLTHFLQSDFRR